MEELIKLFTTLGITGAVVVVLIYDVFILQRKLMSMIENNTKAFIELKDIIEKYLNK
jgi:hypothetical protein